MNKLRPLISLLLLIASAFSTFAQFETGWEIRRRPPDGEFVYDVQKGEIVGNKGVIITYRGVTLDADRLVANEKTGEVQTEGHVTIVGKGHVWEGTNIFYNFKTDEMKAGEFRTGMGPVFIEGAGLNSFHNNEFYSANQSFITTDDYSDPIYKIRASVLIIVPEQYVEAYEATFLLGNVPVFYLPHYKRTLGRHLNNYAVMPGYQGTYGPFLLNTFNWYLNTNLDGAVHLDWRERRGLAGGPDFSYHLGRAGDGLFKYYYTRDLDPNADAVLQPLPSDRKRLSFFHVAEPVTNLTVKLVARYQSDPQVIRDFFENEYRTNVQPASFAEVSKFWPNYTLDVMAKPQIVSFFETVERLPDVKLSAARQQIGVTPVFYEGENSFGYFRREFSHTNDFPSYAAARGDTFHQLVLPQTCFGFLNLAPRVGGRFTYYSDVYGTRVATNEQVRGVFNTGMEVSTKFSRVWRNVESDFWDADGLRHIVEPDFNYVFVPTPTRRPEQLPQFDYESPTLRLLPIDFPDYNAIDSIDSQNVIRLALRNKLQTKRREGVDNLINWAVYTDWRLDPRTNQTRFSEVFSEMDLKPKSWITLNSQIRCDVITSRLTETYHRILLKPNTTWNFSLSHRYLFDPTPDYGHDTYTSSVFYRLNENWGARISHRFEAQSSVLEEQDYTVYRDLRSWTSALTLRFRENRVGGKSDVTVAVSFSLKAFPRYGLGADSERASMLLGQ